jgi:hypothetical protein
LTQGKPIILHKSQLRDRQDKWSEMSIGISGEKEKNFVITVPVSLALDLSHLSSKWGNVLDGDGAWIRSFSPDLPLLGLFE